MEEKYVAILGHQPDLSLVEIESSYGASGLEKFGPAAVFDSKPDITRLGGSPKVGRLIKIVDEQPLLPLLNAVVDEIAERDKKISFGLSFYDFKIKVSEINKTLVAIKKSARQNGINLRFIPSKSAELNAAQVWHNQLDQPPNTELLIVKNGNKLLIACTIGVQNIDAYTKRDRQKPFRDAKVGMLPPKLARTLINLSNPDPGSTLLDPFCGSGTVLLEAMLDGLNVIGTDNSQEMIDGAKKNVEWFRSEYQTDVSSTLEVQDARDGVWENVDTVVAETYLGPVLNRAPDDISAHMNNLNDLHFKFLENIGRQLRSGTRLVLALPSIYDAKNDKYHSLPLVDDLESLQYNRLDFKSVEGDLFYRRPDQIVARHIVVITKE